MTCLDDTLRGLCWSKRLGQELSLSLRMLLLACPRSHSHACECMMELACWLLVGANGTCAFGKLSLSLHTLMCLPVTDDLERY